MKKQRDDFYLGEPVELKSNHLNEQMQDYIHFLRTNIKQLGSQIDFQFERASELIFSLYKHLYSPTQCQGEKATLMNKLSSFGVQWNLQSQFENKPEQPQNRSEEARSINTGYNEAKDVDSNKKAYNMRVKTKPQKYRIEDQYDYTEKRTDGPRRGRPSSRRQNDIEPKRVEQPNPYEKAPYKKRKSYIGDVSEHNGKDESLQRQQAGRGSAKWDSDEEKDEVVFIESGKNIQSDVNDLEKGGIQNGGHHRNGRQEGSIDDHSELARYNENTPISQLALKYQKVVSNPRLHISLEKPE